MVRQHLQYYAVLLIVRRTELVVALAGEAALPTSREAVQLRVFFHCNTHASTLAFCT